MELVFWLGLLIISLIGLIKGADWFTKGAESAGLRLGIPQFVVGVAIVSIGTSLPELASSIAAVLEGAPEIVVANVAGSNIANILFVLGLASIIGGKLVTKRNLAKTDLPILLGFTVIIIIMSLNGVIGFIESLVLLIAMIAYLYHVFQEKETIKLDEVPHGLRAAADLLGGLIVVVIAAKFLIDAVIQIALLGGIDSAVISASVVAFGTSVPEAVVTIVAVLKKKKEIALGNIIGSNIFNILLITGVAGMFGPLPIAPSVLIVALPAMLIATLLLWVVLMDKKITRKEGIFLLATYFLFILLLYV